VDDHPREPVGRLGRLVQCQGPPLPLGSVRLRWSFQGPPTRSPVEGLGKDACRGWGQRFDTTAAIRRPGRRTAEHRLFLRAAGALSGTALQAHPHRGGAGEGIASLLSVSALPYRAVVRGGGRGYQNGGPPLATLRPAFPSSAIISERSSPSRVRFAAPNNGAPLTAPGRS
jgi:hypothetical protein